MFRTRGDCNTETTRTHGFFRRWVRIAVHTANVDCDRQHGPNLLGFSWGFTGGFRIGETSRKRGTDGEERETGGSRGMAEQRQQEREEGGSREQGDYVGQHAELVVEPGGRRGLLQPGRNAMQNPEEIRASAPITVHICRVDCDSMQSSKWKAVSSQCYRNGR